VGPDHPIFGGGGSLGPFGSGGLPVPRFDPFGPVIIIYIMYIYYVYIVCIYILCIYIYYVYYVYIIIFFGLTKNNLYCL
jgi:hypothetical protein